MDSDKQLEARLDAARRRRTLIAVTAITLVLMLLSIGLAWVLAGVNLQAWGLALAMLGSIFAFTRVSGSRMGYWKLFGTLQEPSSKPRRKGWFEMFDEGEMIDVWVLAGVINIVLGVLLVVIG